MAEARAVKECYAHLDGSRREWMTVRSAFDRVLHKDLVYETENGSLNYEQYMDAVKQFHRAGGAVELGEFKQTGPNRIKYTFRTVLPNRMAFRTTERRGTFTDGKLALVQTADVAQFSEGN